MSRQIHISDKAMHDIEAALAWTLEQFGERKYAEYREIIRLALIDIATNPNQAPAKHRPEIHPDARTFHLSRRGQRSRHFLLFRIVDDQTIEIGRLLYDAMELSSHLPPEYEPT